MPSVRVLVVDDSALMRRLLRGILESTADLEWVGQAATGAEALQQIDALQPDVVTLDVDLPDGDGLSVLEQIMRRSPRPVVMLSYLTQAGAGTTVDALTRGAVDVVAKPGGAISVNLRRVSRELVEKIRVAARARVRPATVGLSHEASVAAPQPASVGVPHPSVASSPRPRPAPRNGAASRLVLIGASTGGPQAMSVVVGQLPVLPDVGYLLVQHMPAWLSPWLVERLARGGNPSLEVRLAADGDRVTPGVLLVAPGDQHVRVEAEGCVVRLDGGPRVNGVRPSVDVALESAAPIYGTRLTTVILTGIGEDGAAGAASARAFGGTVLAQDQATCVVWGMPRAVAERGLANEVLAITEIGSGLRRVLAS